jgi:GNAT superfamily N-acetyltransferase
MMHPRPGTGVAWAGLHADALCWAATPDPAHATPRRRIMPLELLPLQPAHRAAWQPLAEGYKAFYLTPTTAQEYDTAWARLMSASAAAAAGASSDGPFGTGAFLDGVLVGLSHHLFHGSTWAPRVCYLQDLFTVPEARGRGVARALIAHVADAARAAGARRYYWLTQEHNATARALYDRVAAFHGFIRYDHPVD